MTVETEKDNAGRFLSLCLLDLRNIELFQRIKVRKKFLAYFYAYTVRKSRDGGKG